MQGYKKQGETVGVVYSVTDGTTNEVVPVPLLDANGVVRPLLTTDRLLIDELQFTTTANDPTQTAYVVASVAAPTAPPASGVVATFSPAQIGAQGQVFPGEGFSAPVGATLWLVLDGAGWTTEKVNLVGTARVINGSTPLGRMPWREKLTPNGNF